MATKRQRRNKETVWVRKSIHTSKRRDETRDESMREKMRENGGEKIKNGRRDSGQNPIWLKTRNRDGRKKIARDERQRVCEREERVAASSWGTAGTCDNVWRQLRRWALYQIGVLLVLNSNYIPVTTHSISCLWSLLLHFSLLLSLALPPCWFSNSDLSGPGIRTFRFISSWWY